jgi:hypothetical protein
MIYKTLLSILFLATSAGIQAATPPGGGMGGGLGSSGTNPSSKVPGNIVPGSGRVQGTLPPGLTGRPLPPGLAAKPLPPGIVKQVVRSVPGGR